MIIKSSGGDKRSIFGILVFFKKRLSRQKDVYPRTGFLEKNLLYCCYRKIFEGRMAVKKINFGGAFFVTGAFMCAAGTPNLSDAAVQARNLQASEIIGVISILCGIILIVGSFLFEKR